MGRVSDIITRARDTLGDPNADRWSDARLLRILDEAQKQTVLKAQLLRTKSTIPLIVGQADYDTPSDCYRPIRFLIDNKPIPLNSHEEMDELASRNIVSTTEETWELYQASPVKRIIYDKLNTGKFKVYPIPESVEGSYGILNSDEDLLTGSLYGITVGATGYSFSSPYGFAVEFSDDYTNQFVQLDSAVDDEYGLTVMFDDNSSNLTIYYLRKPDDLDYPTGSTDLADVPDPEIDDVWDMALKHYVTGKALRDDKDTQNRTLGSEELSFYASDLSDAMRDSSEDFTATRTQFNVIYNNGLTNG